MIHEDQTNPSQPREEYVFVQFKGNRRDIFKNPYEFPFKKDDIVIVEAEQGEDAGRIKYLLKSPLLETIDPPQYSVIRRALKTDLERISYLLDKETTALKTCALKVDSHNLPMSLVDSEYRFDGLKLTFYFTAEGRVDFRELVRDLAGTFRTRIELRQIGARDETKRCDDFGICGRNLCCSTFMTCFQPITTQMAKDQGLIQNPSKLSGVCGRLKCCLAFEHDSYTEGLCPIVGEIADLDEKEVDINRISD